MSRRQPCRSTLLPKRAVAESDRLLSKAELVGRICSYFTCKYVEHFTQAIAKKVA